MKGNILGFDPETNTGAISRLLKKSLAFGDES